MKNKKLNLLVIGGSGFVSGTVVKTAVSQGHDVTVVTRGNKPLPDGIRAITADRKDRSAFKKAIEKSGKKWDAVLELFTDLVYLLPIISRRSKYCFISVPAE